MKSPALRRALLQVWDASVFAHRISANGRSTTATLSMAHDGNWIAVTGLRSPFAVGCGG